MGKAAKDDARYQARLMLVWLVSAIAGMAMLWRYERMPGAVGAVPARLPQGLVTHPIKGCIRSSCRCIRIVRAAGQRFGN